MLLPTQLAQHWLWPSGLEGRGKPCSMFLVQGQAENTLCPCPCRFSSPFLKPVSEKQAPGYKDVVKR